jgi:hypothetical protein
MYPWDGRERGFSQRPVRTGRLLEMLAMALGFEESKLPTMHTVFAMVENSVDAFQRQAALKCQR